MIHRLSTRLVATHLLVAALGAATSYLVVRLLAPALFDESIRIGAGAGGGRGPGGGQGAGQALRASFADAVDRALLIGTLVGVAAAALAGAFAAYRLLVPLSRVREATRRMAAGQYDIPLREPRERELADLAHDVNRLGTALAETEARRVRLLGEVAHEMRTPLTVIDGYVEGMLDGVIPTTPQALGQVGAEVRRLRRLAEDLSSLSRAAEGRLDVTPAPVELVGTVTNAVERLRAQADERGVALTVVAPAPVMVQADADRLAQVVTNLVGNALRATESGGSITVGIGLGDGPDTAFALITVTDSGEGIAPDQLERIFERFYRVRCGRREAGDSGSGIGLTIARDLIRAHGGDLRAASAGRGQGSTFTVALPLPPH